jgi:hypothetical protein
MQHAFNMRASPAQMHSLPCLDGVLLNIITSLPACTPQVSLIGMNAELMGTYVEYVADRLLVSLGTYTASTHILTHRFVDFERLCEDLQSGQPV